MGKIEKLVLVGAAFTFGYYFGIYKLEHELITKLLEDKSKAKAKESA